MDLDQIAQQIAEDIETQCTDVTDPFIEVIVRRAIRDARRAGREQAACAVSAERCPECRAGDVPEYDERYKAWYHDRLLCLGSPARLAIRAHSDD
jgi:hypothetical protein